MLGRGADRVRVSSVPPRNFMASQDTTVIESHVTDDQLILAVRGGSNDAFEALFQRYRGPIWQFFRRRVADAGRAEELTQDAFVALLEGAHRYEARTAFRSYLFGIAYHLLSA